MKFDTMTQVLTLVVLSATMILQGMNAYKYWKTNGANTTRVVLMLVNFSFITHTVRLMLEYTNGYFFTLGIIFLFSLYSKDWIRDKLKI